MATRGSLRSHPLEPQLLAHAPWLFHPSPFVVLRFGPLTFPTKIFCCFGAFSAVESRKYLFLPRLPTVGKGRIFGVDPIRFIPDWRRMGVRHPIPNGSRLPSLRYVSSLEVDDPTPKNRAGERSMNRRGSSVP